MTRSSSRVLVAACAGLAVIGWGPMAVAGGPIQHRAVPAVPGYRPAPPMTTGARVVVPLPTAARRPYLGTFRPDPSLLSYSGAGTTGAFSPAGLPTAYATMSFYGPFSRLRSIPNEVVTYSRGYDGVLRPTSSGIVYEYPDPRRYRDTTLLPNRDRYDPFTGNRVRSGFGRYLLGQD